MRSYIFKGVVWISTLLSTNDLALLLSDPRREKIFDPEPRREEDFSCSRVWLTEVTYMAAAVDGCARR